VGEVNVVELMKKNKVVIGGEGNGGIIYPELHYGRDALVGVALFLSLLAEKQLSVSALKQTYPQYYMSKNKIELTEGLDVDGILEAIAEQYKTEEVSTIDGVKINFKNSWVHLRKSNTEPIIRIYTEAPSQQQANDLAEQIIANIKAVANI
jgi:phosphomannomutase